MSEGRTLKVYVMSQNPLGLKMVEIVNWTGLAYIGSREDIRAIRERQDLASPGVYFLLSEEEEGGSLLNFYVGETDDFSSRIINHVREKDWWSKFVVFISKDQNLTKAHVKFLEREIYLLARQSITTLKLVNSIEPGGSRLPEPDQAAMGEFLRNMCFVMEALGLSYFPSYFSTNQKIHTLENPYSQSTSVDGLFKMTLAKDSRDGDPNVFAKLEVQDSLYILKSGSYITKKARESFERKGSYYSLWKQIAESDAVEATSIDGVLRTVRDLEFRSPSAAGAVVRARNTNGRTDWMRIGDGKSLNECEEAMAS